MIYENSCKNAGVFLCLQKLTNMYLVRKILTTKNV